MTVRKNLSCLTAFPFDKIKIDKSFISTLMTLHELGDHLLGGDARTRPRHLRHRRRRGDVRAIRAAEDAGGEFCPRLSARPPDAASRVRRPAAILALAPGRGVAAVTASRDRLRSARPKANFRAKGMVLPDRIELSTSPLPMECSTTELRQHARIKRIGRNGPYRRADPCHKAPARASAGAARRTTKNGQNQRREPAAAFIWASCGPIRCPISSASACSALIGRIMTWELEHLRR